MLFAFYNSSVLEENLQSHLKRCPFFKQAQSLSIQPFYQEGINAGKEEEEGVQNFSSEMKRNAVHGMTLFEFSQLINKIKSIHASICSDIGDSFKIPQACDIWTNRQVDRCSTIVLFRMCCVHFMFPLMAFLSHFQTPLCCSFCRGLPFQEKHVMQQASILGNLEEFGVLKSCKDDAVSGPVKLEASGDDDDVPAVVEFGAGRGYLTQVLADCYRIKKILLVERKSYKLKVRLKSEMLKKHQDHAFSSFYLSLLFFPALLY